MWLRASYTVENAVITPLFMLIIIVVMRASCDIHDNLIQRSVNSQFVIQTECRSEIAVYSGYITAIINTGCKFFISG